MNPTEEVEENDDEEGPGDDQQTPSSSGAPAQHQHGDPGDAEVPTSSARPQPSCSTTVETQDGLLNQRPDSTSALESTSGNGEQPRGSEEEQEDQDQPARKLRRLPQRACRSGPGSTSLSSTSNGGPQSRIGGHGEGRRKEANNQHPESASTSTK